MGTEMVGLKVLDWGYMLAVVTAADLVERLDQRSDLK